jgi:D-glycero-D-manno-heptose 1,7-bisphosphate phosphatase
MKFTMSHCVKPALFLDRDGVINVEKSYVHHIKDFEFVDGIFELCRAAIEKGMRIVVVTNQAGIGRGFYTEAQFQTLTDWMLNRFDEEEVHITAMYFCPFHPEHGVGLYRKESYDRKPNPGMIFRARDEYGINLSKSILIGDKESDITAGRAAGVGLTILFGRNTDSAMPSVTIQTLSDALPILSMWSIDS